MKKTKKPLQRHRNFSVLSASGGLGAFGAFHNVCHYTCQSVVALAALLGVSLAGMPLGFLLDSRLVVLFSAIGLVSSAIGIYFMQLNRPARKWKSLISNRSFLLSLGFGAISAVSLVLGAVELVSGTTGNAELNVDSLTKTNDEGNIAVEVTYAGIREDELTFSVSMDSYDMSAPPLSVYNLKELAYFSSGQASVKPLQWNIETEGHMGHHIRGTLLFPGKKDGLPILAEDMTSFDLVFNDVGGVKQRTFSWNVVRS